MVDINTEAAEATKHMKNSILYYKILVVIVFYFSETHPFQRKKKGWVSPKRKGISCNKNIRIHLDLLK